MDTTYAAFGGPSRAFGFAIAITLATACARPPANQPPARESAARPAESPSPRAGEHPPQSTTCSEGELLDLLASSDISLLSKSEFERARCWYASVERWGHADDDPSLRALYAVLLGAYGDLHLQRAALFSLVRRAPTSLELARQLLDHDVPELSQRVHFVSPIDEATLRSYERGLAVAVLGTSGLVQAREPLEHALASAPSDSERLLFTLGLARQGDGGEVLRSALARTPLDTRFEAPLAMAIVQLVPGMEDLLVPCHFEIARVGEPTLAVEALAQAAEDLSVEMLAPSLIERGRRLEGSNPMAAAGLLTAAAHLAAPPLFASVQQDLKRVAHATEQEWLDIWADELAGAFTRCGEDLACHFRSLDAEHVDVSHFKSAMLVAARATAAQAPALLDHMERMARPDWLAVALDQRLPHPLPEQLTRVRALVPRGPDDAALYAPQTACSLPHSPLEELAIRLEVRMAAGE